MRCHRLCPVSRGASWHPRPAPALAAAAQTISAGIQTVQRIHKAGLQVHIYTLRNEAK